MILADFGATVIRVEIPGGPLWDSPANATLNRNKRIVTLDLKTGEGMEQVRQLIAEADILVESFRPGTMARMCLDFGELRNARPELITLSTPGVASKDELRRDWRAYESVIAASSGVFTATGLNRVLMGIKPSFSPLPLASAVMEGLSYNSIKIEDYPDRYKTQRELEIERRRIEGLPINISYDDLQELLDPFAIRRVRGTVYVLKPAEKFCTSTHVAMQ